MSPMYMHAPWGTTRCYVLPRTGSTMQILLAAEVYFIHRIKKEKQSLEVEDGEAVRWSTGLAPGWQGGKELAEAEEQDTKWL